MKSTLHTSLSVDECVTRLAEATVPYPDWIAMAFSYWTGPARRQVACRINGSTFDLMIIHPGNCWDRHHGPSWCSLRGVICRESNGGSEITCTAKSRWLPYRLAFVAMFIVIVMNTGHSLLDQLLPKCLIGGLAAFAALVLIPRYFCGDPEDMVWFLKRTLDASDK